MLTGKRAFEGQNPARVIAAILEREPAPLDVVAAVSAVRAGWRAGGRGTAS